MKHKKIPNHILKKMEKEKLIQEWTKVQRLILNANIYRGKIEKLLCEKI